MRQTKSSKKNPSRTIRFRPGDLQRFKRAAAADRRSLNGFVILACEQAAAAVETKTAEAKNGKRA